MSRYGDRFKDDLYDELVYRYEDSKMTLAQFVAVVLEMLGHLLEHSEYYPPKLED